MRSIRQHLATSAPLEQPGPTILLAASVSFTAPDAAYRDVRLVLLTSPGHGSDRGTLLRAA
jgi:hypothetical protein